MGLSLLRVTLSIRMIRLIGKELVLKEKHAVFLEMIWMKMTTIEVKGTKASITVTKFDQIPTEYINNLINDHF